MQKAVGKGIISDYYQQSQRKKRNYKGCLNKKTDF